MSFDINQGPNDHPKNGYLWGVLFGKYLWFVTFVLSSLSLGRTNGWITIDEWFDGVVLAFANLSRRITEAILSLLPFAIDIDQKGSDLLWITFVILMPLTLVFLSFKRPKYLSFGDFLFRKYLPLGILFLHLFAGVVMAFDALTGYDGNRDPYGFLVFSILFGFLCSMTLHDTKGTVFIFHFWSNYVAALLIVWGFILAGVVDVVT